MKRRCEEILEEFKEHAHEIYQSAGLWGDFEPINPDSIPLDMPDIKLVAAFRGECQTDFGCLETESLGALNHITAQRINQIN
jgi:hypothetical protein